MRKYIITFIIITFLSGFYGTGRTTVPFPAKEFKTAEKEVSDYVDSTPEPIRPLTVTDGLLNPDESPLSIDNQLFTILKFRKKWQAKYEDIEHHYYTVTDFDRNGRLELIVSTRPLGSGCFTTNWYFQISEDGSKLEKCKGGLSGKDGHDICEDIDTVYTDDKGQYYYGVSGTTHISGYEQYSSLGVLTLKDNVMSDIYLGGHKDVWEYNAKTDKTKKISNTYYQDENDKEHKIKKKDYNLDYLAAKRFGDLEKKSVNIDWFTFAQNITQVTDAQLYHKLKKSAGNFHIQDDYVPSEQDAEPYYTIRLSEVNWDLPQMQYEMTEEDYAVLWKYVPILKNGYTGVDEDGNRKSLEEYMANKRLLGHIQFTDITKDGVPEVCLEYFHKNDYGYVIISLQGYEYYLYDLPKVCTDLSPSGIISNIQSYNDEGYTNTYTFLNFENGKFEQTVLAEYGYITKTDTHYYKIGGEVVTEKEFYKWEENTVNLNNQYELISYPLDY